MVNANEMGSMISKKLRELTPKDIEDITNVYDKHSKGEEIENIGFAKTIKLPELEEND
jgi:type I restriction enzyme M protein